MISFGTITRRFVICFTLIVFGLGLQPILAQEDEAAEEEIEEVIVTGSYLKRKSQFDSPSPIAVTGSEDIAASGAFGIDDFTDTLTLNTGSQNNPDAFTQNFSTGTTNINLRGLGVSSTLVLLNGRRQVQSAAATDRGENFVDTASLVPKIAIDRVETLKDGATALYGSDAVAGVVNFYTRSDFRGFELSIPFQSTSSDSQTDTEISGIWGIGSDDTGLVVSFSYLDRDPLYTSDRDLPMRQDVSIFGQPGSYIIPTRPSGPSPVFVGVWSAAYDSNSNGVADFFEGLPGALLPVLADPDCPTVAAQDPNIIAPSTFPAGLCEFDFGLFYNLVPQEKRLQIFAEFNHYTDSGLHFRAELGHADNEAERGNSPSFPILALPPIPAEHPHNPFGTTAVLAGRVAGAFGDRNNSFHDSKTTRFAAELSGGSDVWSWTTALTYSDNNFVLDAGDTLADEFFAALYGSGGPNNDTFYNPFGTQYTTSPNDPAVVAEFSGRLVADADSNQLTAEAVIVNDALFDLGGGSAGLAFGVNYRDEELEYDYNDDANRDNFLFLVGNPDFAESRDVTAFFVELGLPFADAFEAQLAIRYEDYGSSVNSTDPKVALRWTPNDLFTLRASAGTSFRAPSLFQEFGTQTSLQQILDPLNPGLSFRAVRAQADPSRQLVPEEADVFNVGSSFNIGDNWTFDVDYWSFDYSDVIIQQNAQALLFANPNGPQIIRDPTTGVLLRIDTFYSNASSLETNGFDLALNGNWDVGNGRVGFVIDATVVNTYDLEDPQAGSIDGAGSRNFTNFGTSVPELRGNLGLSWSNVRHSVNAFARHIDSYKDDQNNDVNIDSHTTFDLQYNLRTPGFGALDEGILFSLGGINVTDEEPPGVLTNGGFDSKVHDPRGRLYYVKVTFPF